MSQKSKAKALVDKVLKGRPKPSSPRAGYRHDKSRYEKGGKLPK